MFLIGTCYRICMLVALLPAATALRADLARLKTVVGSAIVSITLFANPCLADEIVPYGVVDGRLKVCPSSGNCLSTASIRSIDKYARPWVYERDTEAQWTAIKSELATNPLFRVVDTQDALHYIRAEARSAVVGTDDLELLLLPADQLVTFRSNSREVVKVGASVVGDGGSHLNRLKSIRNHLKLREMGVEDDNEQFFQMQQQASFLNTLKSGFGYTSNKPDDINFLDNSVPGDALE
jgi:uncharacterized protein (DUF1499 family)